MLTVREWSGIWEGLGDGGKEEEEEEIRPVDADGSQEVHLATVVEILQSIKQADMSPMLSRIYSSEGGTELLDVLMKYLYASSPLYEPPL